MDSIHHDKSTQQRTSIIANLIIFGIGVSSTVFIFAALRYTTPVNPNAKPIQFKISHGATAKSIAGQLAREDLIRHPFTFELMVRLTGAGRELKAGAYQLSGAMSVVEIVDRLRAGNVVLRRFVIPEGLTVPQIGQLWENGKFGTATAFEQAARNPRWRQRYSIDAETLEGYLFPNTYQFADGTPVDSVIKMLLDEFDRGWTHLLSEEAKALGFSTHEIITLASIIEKEAKADDERPLIAAVYHNRLKRGWRLEADPTVLYALGNPERLLRTADLKVSSSYNTYLHRGLPPGPICNPGMASVKAALRPAQASYLYFVAIGGGRHYFSTRLVDHRAMIRKIRRRVN